MAYAWTMLDVLYLLGIRTNQSKVEVEIDCPFCHKKRFAINQVKGVGHCWSCDAPGVDSVGLYAAYEGISLAEARAAIKEKLGIDQNNQRINNIPPRVVMRPPSEESKMADINHRNKVYQAFFDEITLSEKNKAMLIARGFDPEEIEAIGYRTLPARDEIDFIALCKRLQMAGHNLKGIPGFFQLRNGDWTFVSMTKGILMPQRDKENRIFGLQLRKDDDLRQYDPDTGKLEHKCCWFSSKNCRSGCGAEANESVHFATDFKLKDGRFIPILGDTIILTEGSMKANLIHALMKNAPVISIPGVNILDPVEGIIPFLKEFEVKTILLCFDMDYKSNEKVQRALEKMENTIKKNGLNFIQKDWVSKVCVDDTTYDLKGLDDYMAFHIKGILPKLVTK